MTTQQYLDQTPETNKIAVTQNILLKYTKTPLTSLQSAMRMMTKNAIYKTQYKAMTWGEIMECVDDALGMITSEKQENEKLADENGIRRRGNR